MRDITQEINIKKNMLDKDNIINFDIDKEYYINPNFKQNFNPKKGVASISLIIPVYQEEKIIEQTLLNYTSDIKKKYNIELIISDGGSTDKTIEIAKNYADKIIVHKENRKQTIAEGRNKGASIANGEILIFMNGDTVPAYTEEFFSQISKWGFDAGFYSTNIALTCFVSVSPDEILFKDKIFYFIHNRYIRFLNFIGLGMGRGECQIVKANYFKMIDGYDDKLAAGEDFDLFRRLAKIGKIGFINNLTVYESPRRFRKYGYFKVIMSWIYNSLSVMLYGKSVSDDWEPVR